MSTSIHVHIRAVEITFIATYILSWILDKNMKLLLIHLETDFLLSLFWLNSQMHRYKTNFDLYFIFTQTLKYRSTQAKIQESQTCPLVRGF